MTSISMPRRDRSLLRRFLAVCALTAVTLSSACAEEPTEYPDDPWVTSVQDGSTLTPRTTQVESAAPNASSSGTQSGLIYVALPNGGVPQTLHLWIIDPDTGSESPYASFAAPTGVRVLPPMHSMRKSVFVRTGFSSNFDRAVAVELDEKNGHRLGWVDTDGRFTEVAAPGDDEDDFSGKRLHSSPIFGHDDAFYYLDLKRGEVMRAAPGSTVAQSYGVFGKGVNQVSRQGASHLTYDFYVAESGEYTLFSGGGNGTFDIASDVPGVVGMAVEDWVDSYTYLTQKYNNTGSNSNPIYLCTADPTVDPRHHECSDSLTPETDLIMTEVTTGPDAETFAFVGSRDGTRYLYTSAIRNGQPTKVPGFETQLNMWLVDWI